MVANAMLGAGSWELGPETRCNEGHNYGCVKLQLLQQQEKQERRSGLTGGGIAAAEEVAHVGVVLLIGRHCSIAVHPLQFVSSLLWYTGKKEIVSNFPSIPTSQCSSYNATSGQA